MGLDVYCRWPNITEEEKQAQYTGFQSVGDKGYLRKSWGSLDAWDNVFKEVFGITWSDVLWPGWNGYNDGEGPDLTKEDVRNRLEQNRKMILQYVEEPKPVPEILKSYFGKWDDAQKTISEEAKSIADFIELALSKKSATIQFS